MAVKPRIVVVGAGVSGLTTALELAKTGKYDVAVVAKHMPGDFDISYASPWAGANYLPTSRAGHPSEKYDRDTWHVLERLAREVPEAGIHFQDETRPFNYPKEGDSTVSDWMAEMLSPSGPWYKDLLPNFRILDPSETAGYDTGIAFTSLCINVNIYLPWLTGQLLIHKVHLRRASLTHLSQARHAHPSGQPASLIINATGLSSYSLPGVADHTMYPARGQIAVVRNEPRVMFSSVGDDDCPADELCYIMQRAAGGGTVIGGCYQVGSWDGKVDEGMARRILERAVKVCPELTAERSLQVGEEGRAGKGVEALDVVQHRVGLRPCRKGGIRVESESYEDGTRVVHNYGHGGTGYQASWGCAFRAVELVREAFEGAAGKNS